MSIIQLLALAKHPRALLDSMLTYPRFLGTIKPRLMSKSEQQIQAVLANASAGYWPSSLECPVGRRILVISPHPDDESIGAGGLLMRHKHTAEIGIVCLFNGEGGGSLANEQPGFPEYRQRLVSARAMELVAACRHFGAKLIDRFEITDGQNPSNGATSRLETIARDFRPDVVVIPSFLDQQVDHRAANRLWAQAGSAINCMVMATEIWTLHVLPNAYLDITDVFKVKLEGIRLFESQLATIDYLSLAEGLARLRGFHSGAGKRRSGFAEAYLVLPNHDYCELAANYLSRP